MARKVTYWVTTGLLAAMSLLAAFTYLSGSPEAVQGFTHVGYPQQLRIILGIAKVLGAITCDSFSRSTISQFSGFPWQNSRYKDGTTWACFLAFSPVPYRALQAL